MNLISVSLIFPDVEGDRQTMANLKDTLIAKIPQWRADIARLLHDHNKTVIAEITVEHLFKGLRGVPAIHCDTSTVDPERGLFIRGIPVLDLINQTPEAVFFLLCTGELPDEDAHRELRKDLRRRVQVPYYVWNLIHNMPDDTHPMVLLSLSMLAMQRESVFLKRYNEGMSRDEHWEATLEDALTIIARLPSIAAGIYRLRIARLDRISALPEPGFVENFTHMLGIKDPRGYFHEFIRRFAIVHSDHEGANASVITSRVANSTLSDLYYSISGAMNCLSGPLHGLANQESVRFTLDILNHFQGVPEAEPLRAYLEEFLGAGKIVPGFGHAVLRNTDPRYTALHELGKEICPDLDVFQMVELLAEVVPPLLIEQGKAKNPYPNIDGISGVLLYHFGITDLSFYTVMFSVTQVLGICAQLVINRALMSPIFRPRSITTEALQNFVKSEK